MALQLYTIQTPHTHNFSGTPILFSFAVAPYTSRERARDIRISIRIEKEVSLYTDLWTEVKNQLIYPEQGGKVSLDIASIADAYLKYHTPNINQKYVTHMPEQQCRFRVVAITQVDGVQLGDAVTTDPVMIYKGGLAYEQYHPSSYFAQRVAVDKQPLHYYTDREMVHFTDKKFMTFILHNDESEPRLRVRWTTPAGDFENGILLPEDILLKLDGLYYFPCGVTEINATMMSAGFAGAISTKTMIKYSVEVYLNGAGGDFILVAEQTFYIDYRKFYNTTQLFYKNSTGGTDDIAILGEIDAAAEYESLSAQQVTPPGGIADAILQPQNLSWARETEKFTGSTTFITKDKVAHLRDLLLSPSVFELKDGRLVPVIINKKNVKFYGSKDSLFSLAIEWQHAFSNEFYTPPLTLAADATCPALLSFQVAQISRTKLQVMWSCPMPYDKVEIEIDNGTPEDLITTTLTGNTGSQEIEIINEVVYPGTLDLIIKARVVCSSIYPGSYGPYTELPFEADGNSLPVPADDVFTLQAGFTIPQTMPFSVLDNDYDPDGDAIECTPAAGATTAGGTYTIALDGTVTYTPPSATYNGVDSFPYTCRDVLQPALAVAAQVRIQVGNINLGNNTYVKIIERNHYEKGRDAANSTFRSGGDYYLTFWADPAATIAKNLTGLGITINVKRDYYTWSNVTNAFVLQTTATTGVAASGTEQLHFSGETLYLDRWLSITVGRKTVYSVVVGTGYIPI